MNSTYFLDKLLFKLANLYLKLQIIPFVILVLQLHTSYNQIENIQIN